MEVIQLHNNKYEDFITKLSKSLTSTLPGIKAHKLMSPHHRKFAPEAGMLVKQAAVLIPLTKSVQGLSLLFTVRAARLLHHGGEVSFPGGRAEEADKTLAETALRELEEELGISAQYVHILGALTPLYISVSKNLVHPFLGWIPKLPIIHPSAQEVDKVFKVEINKLLNPKTLGDYEWLHKGQKQRAPCYKVNGFEIWGATAMITSEFLEIIRHIA